MDTERPHKLIRFPSSEASFRKLTRTREKRVGPSLSSLLPLSMSLTPTQEHYLKRELLRLATEDEFALFNDPHVLRRFGDPFAAGDPKEVPKDQKKRQIDSALSHEFPLSRYFFTHIVVTMPFLTPQHQDYNEFWVRKVQVFYEHFMSMSMSETLDRDEATKRKKMGLKLQRLLLMMFNSGIGTANEVEYYDKDKLDITKGAVESKRIRKLLFPSSDTLQMHITKGHFSNGISINVAGVRAVKKANNKFLSGLNLTKTHEMHYEFIVKSQLDIPESDPVFIARRYTDFKDLHHRLKKKFPGKHLPKLPSKVKSMISLGGSDEPEDEADDMDEDDKEEELEEEQLEKQHDEEIRKNLASLFKDLKLDEPRTPKDSSTEKFESRTPREKTMLLLSPSKWGSARKPTPPQPENKLPREKTRVGLRSYLRELLKDVEIAHCDLLKEFLFKERLRKLEPEDEVDIKIRENVDLLLLLNQVKFQREAYAKITNLKEQSLPLRAMLLESDDGIVRIFGELKVKAHMSELSPTLRNFLEWCKVEIAATIYQLFLGNDNSYELYSQVRRLHKLMPYTVMINILRFTNPMVIIKTMVDLMMASPFGGKSLLQNLFYGILSDDMKSQSKVIMELEEKIGHEEIIKRLKYFVYDCTDYDLVQSVKEEAKELGTDVVLTVMITPQLYELSEIDDNLIGKVFESYNEYKKLKEFEKEPTQLNVVNHEQTELYSELKSLYKLYVRNKDKEIMQQLWSEPELTSILRELFTMFYQPLVSLFSSAHVDVAFRGFEHFMDDLVTLLDRLSHDMYTTDTSKIVDSIMKVIEGHQDEFYQFVHETYVNDKQGIFDKLILWINDILMFLRNAKDIGQTNHLRVDLEELLKGAGVDAEAIISELDAVIDSVKRKHEEYEKKWEKQKNKTTGLVEDNWDAINNIEIFQTSDFGINEHDIVDLDSDGDDGDDGDDDGSIGEEEKKKKRREHDHLPTANIEQLLPGFKEQLIGVLKSYD